MLKNEPRASRRKASWRAQVRIAALSILGLFLYGFLEWLFFITKPSFLSALNWWEQWQVLLATLAVPMGFVLCLHLLLLILAGLFPWSVWKWLGALVPATVLAVTALMLVDNFTYTLFDVGVKTIDGWWRALYLTSMAAIAVAVCRRVSTTRVSTTRFERPWLRPLLPAGLVVVLAAQALLSHWRSDPGIVLSGAQEKIGEKVLPNIVLLSSDGLNASHISAYGYEKATTPFLDNLVDSSLVAENSFTNAGATAASITSRLTGKWPTQTRLIYPPDILRGEDSYQHLPGLLRRMGYTGLDLSIRHYADSVDLNFREAFDRVNFRSVKRPAGLGSDWFGLDTSYFLYQLQDRLFSRMRKILQGIPMDKAFEEATEGDRSFKRDPQRMKELFDFIDSQTEPFFCHVHLMGTHGSRFRTHNRVFSKGLKQEQPWMTEFYDDAILDFDDYVRQLADFLKERNLFDRTVLIIGSDHGQRFRMADRIPLLIRFPEGDHAGRISANVQNLDIAPTLLDYLGRSIPQWMVGRSLLSDSLDPNYPILAANRGGNPTTVTQKGRQLDTSEIRAPFYSLGQISVILCSEAYRLYLENGIISHYTIPGHTSPCASTPEASQIESLLLDHLKAQEYDTGNLQQPMRVMETTHGF